MPVTYLNRRDIRLHVEVQGAGPAVVFGHGLICDSHMFTSIARPLSAAYQTVNFDFRGHGKSTSPSSWSLDDLADDYLTAVDAFELQTAVLVGFSMGGMAALRFALRHPERVRALILIATDADTAGWRQYATFHLLASLTRRFGLHDQLLERAERIAFSPAFRRTSPETVTEWQTRIKMMSPETVADAVCMIADRSSIADRLPKIGVPALIIAGEEDITTPVACAERMARRLPNSRLEVLPGAGHLVPIERPAETLQLVRGFLATIEEKNASPVEALPAASQRQSFLTWCSGRAPSSRAFRRYWPQLVFSLDINVSTRCTRSGNDSSASYGSVAVRYRYFSCRSDSQVVRYWIQCS